jgi:hypothetical protein
MSRPKEGFLEELDVEHQVSEDYKDFETLAEAKGVTNFAPSIHPVANVAEDGGKASEGEEEDEA